MRSADGTPKYVLEYLVLGRTVGVQYCYCQYYELAYARGVSRLSILRARAASRGMMKPSSFWQLCRPPSAVAAMAAMTPQGRPDSPAHISRRRRPGAGCCQRNGSDDTATQARQPGAPGAGKGRYALSTSDDDNEGAVPAPFVETKLVPWNRIPVGGQTDDPRATPSDRTWRAWGRLVKYSNGGKRD